MPFVEQFHRCMKLPHEGDIIDTFLVQSIKLSHRNIIDGIYFFPIDLVIIGEGGTQNASKSFKPIFNKVLSLFTQYGSLYQCRCDKLEIESLGPKTYKIKTTGIANRIYPKQELEAFMHFLKESTGMHEIQVDTIITAYLNYYQTILQC